MRAAGLQGLNLTMQSDPAHSQQLGDRCSHDDLSNGLHWRSCGMTLGACSLPAHISWEEHSWQHPAQVRHICVAVGLLRSACLASLAGHTTGVWGAADLS